MDYSKEELENALEASVILQSHYAKLLNQYDLGERMSFSNAGEWIARLRELKQSTEQDPRLLTTDAPEMTVGDSGSVSEHSTNKRICEYCEEAPPNLIGICDSCYELIFERKRLKKQLCEEIEHDISFDAGYKYCPDCGELLLPPYQENRTPSPTPSFR